MMALSLSACRAATASVGVQAAAHRWPSRYTCSAEQMYVRRVYVWQEQVDRLSDNWIVRSLVLTLRVRCVVVGGATALKLGAVCWVHWAQSRQAAVDDDVI